jgi:zinc protease
VGALVGLALVDCAPTPPSMQVAVPVREFKLSQVTLPSGLQIIVEADPAARVVVSALAVGAGSAEDPPGQEGLAHLVEHLTFRARTPGEPALSSRLALNGIGSWNATTSMDHTTYYQVGAPETLQRMIEVEVGRMLDPLQGVDVEHFAGERGVVINELHARDESGLYQEIRRQLFRQLFPAEHPYARAGGTDESVGRLTLDQARAFVQTHYVPSEMTWVLAGALDPGQVAAMLDRDVPPRLRDAAPPSSASHHAAAIGREPPAPATLPTVIASVPRPEVLLGWVLPPSNDRMEPVYATLPAFVEARAYGVRGVEGASAEIYKFSDASVLTLAVALEEGRAPEEVVQKLRADWEVFWREGTQTGMDWMERQFARVRAASIVYLARHNESLLTRTLDRAERARATRSAATLKAQSEAVAALTYKDVLAAGRMSITGEDLRAVVLKPRTGTVREEDAPAQLVPPAFAPEQLRAEYPSSVVAAFVRGPHLAAAKRFVASNGLQVEVVPEGKTGLVTATLAIAAGRRTSSPVGLADRFRWSHQRREYGRPVSIGASERGVWTDDSGFLEYRGSAGNLSNLLAMLSERVLTLRADDPPRSLHDSTSERESHVFDRAFWSTVEGDSAAPTLTPSEIARLDGDAADRWWEAIMDPRRSVLILAGDVQDNVQDEVEHWLGRWHGLRDSRAFTLPPPPAAPGALRVVRVPMKQSKQVRVRLGCTVATSSLEQELATRMLGLELERKWNALERETLGSSYGFGASTVSHRDGSMQVLVSGRVDNGSVRRMTLAVSQAWKGLPEMAGTENALNRLRWEFGRSYNVRFLTSQTLAQAVAEEHLRGRTAGALDEIPAALMRVGPADLAEIGKQCQRSAVYGLLGDPVVLDVDALLPADRIEVKP